MGGHSRIRRFGASWRTEAVWGTRQRWFAGTPVDQKFGGQSGGRVFFMLACLGWYLVGRAGLSSLSSGKKAPLPSTASSLVAKQD